MKVAGVDVGSLATKAVILDNGNILSQSVIVTSDEKSAAAERALGKALQAAGLSSKEDLARIVATGIGRKGIPFIHDSRAIVSCLAKVVHHLFPSGRTAIDLGAESCHIIKLDESGLIRDIQENDKCAAGTGTFFDAMAKLAGISVEEMSALSIGTQRAVQLTSMCVIFAEQELISYIHQDPPTPLNELVAGIQLAIAVRIAGLARRVGIEEEVVLTGGVANNIGFVSFLEKELGVSLKRPKDPQMALALGAALHAQDSV